MKNKEILYIGNNLTRKTKYNTSMETLSGFLSNDGYTIHRSSNKMNKFLRLLDMCLSIVKKRNRVAYILIDTFSTSNFYFALATSQIARFFKIKYIPILRGGNLPHRIHRSRRFSNLLFKNSYYNVAPSNYLKAAFEKKGYSTMLIPNLLEIENYPFQERKKIKPTLFWVRAFKHLYNPSLAVAVLDLLKKEFPEATLCMVGPPKDDSFEITKELAEKLNVLDAIEFTGVLPKEEWHQRSKDFDIFINTTNFDNTPVSVMEAMALGLTIVSTNVGGMPYLIEDNKDGILVDKENPKQMAAAIKKLIADNNQTLAKNARIKAESFGWNVVRKKWHSILK